MMFQTHLVHLAKRLRAFSSTSSTFSDSIFDDQRSGRARSSSHSAGHARALTSTLMDTFGGDRIAAAHSITAVKPPPRRKSLLVDLCHGFHRNEIYPRDYAHVATSTTSNTSTISLSKRISGSVIPSILRSVAQFGAELELYRHALRGSASLVVHNQYRRTDAYLANILGLAGTQYTRHPTPAKPLPPRPLQLHNTTGKIVASSVVDLFESHDLTGQVKCIGSRFVACGGYSEVWKGEWVIQNPPAGKVVKEVAIKILRISAQLDPEKLDQLLQKRLRRECAIWQLLRHPNIVPFLGYVFEKDGERIMSASLVAPWYAHGTIVQYLSTHPDADRLLLCEDVARGLGYLHTRNPVVVHGDMKGANILITEDGRAAICDFGLSTMIDDLPTGFTTSLFGGTIRYLAPELLDNARRSCMSDVWAFACTCVEVLFSRMPYAVCTNEGAVYRSLERGVMPYGFDDEANHGHAFLENDIDVLRELLYSCWSHDPDQRPTMDHICEVLSQIIQRRPQSSPTS